MLSLLRPIRKKGGGDNMAKNQRGGRRGGGASGGLPTGYASNAPVNARPLTDAEADRLRNQQDSAYDASTTAAVKMYISRTDFDGQNHSLSQTMNYLLDEGVDLNSADLGSVNSQYGLSLTPRDWASLQYTNNYMAAAMHPIGQDVELQRGAHDDLLRNTFGINDYSRYSESQLQAMLVGQAFRNTAPMSTSYDINKNPFLSASSGSGVSGGREVVYRIKAGAKTRMLFGAKAQSEIILAAGTDWKITNVRYTGNTATPRGQRSRPQIEISIETP